MPDVLVVGAGPVGLTLACELARHGVRCRLIDKLPQPLPYCRAIGVTPRTLEVWEDMGIAREMIDAGLWITGMRSVIHGHPPQENDVPDLGLPFSALGLPQYETERLLTAHLARYGVAPERGIGLATIEQDAEGVYVGLADAAGGTQQARFSYVVGCDGAHSTVRRALGIGFEGDAYPWPFMLGDVKIDWDLPYGRSLRAMRLVVGGPPDMFIAIPLPEAGRYRVSMLAPAGLAPPGKGSDHGIQTELKGPTLEALQAVAADMLPGEPRLSDLRWSSIFRISMRLAERYRDRRVFIAGDAAHIHPPTGGQGMNTGIQDAYNLAWKLGLVLRGSASVTLLASYEAERRPVGADVVSRTRAATENYGREPGQAPDRRADTQVLISYRDSALVHDDAAPDTAVQAGDRAPDIHDLRRQGLGFPLRLFEVLQGTDHVLLVAPPPQGAAWVEGLGARVKDLASRFAIGLRVVAIAPDALPEQPGVTVLHDPAGAFAQTYAAGAVLVRPDGHIGWRGTDWRDDGLQAYLARLCSAVQAAE